VYQRIHRGGWVISSSPSCVPFHGHVGHGYSPSLLLPTFVSPRISPPDQLQSSPQQALTAAMEDIVLQYTYPRIDAEVSKHRNHLLKAPFCVHPGTGGCIASLISSGSDDRFGRPDMHFLFPSFRPSLCPRRPATCARV